MLLVTAGDSQPGCCQLPQHTGVYMTATVYANMQHSLQGVANSYKIKAISLLIGYAAVWSDCAAEIVKLAAAVMFQ